MNKNSEYPVYIVVCWKGRIEKATGVSVLQRDWDTVDDFKMLKDSWHCSENAIKAVREAFEEIASMVDSLVI